MRTAATLLRVAWQTLPAVSYVSGKGLCMFSKVPDPSLFPPPPPFSSLSSRPPCPLPPHPLTLHPRSTHTHRPQLLLLSFLPPRPPPPPPPPHQTEKCSMFGKFLLLCTECWLRSWELLVPELVGSRFTAECPQNKCFCQFEALQVISRVGAKPNHSTAHRNNTNVVAEPVSRHGQ